MTEPVTEQASTEEVITPARRRLLIIGLPLLALSVALTGLVIAQDLLPGTRQYTFTTEIAAVPELTVSTGRTGVDLEFRTGNADRIRVDASGGYSGEIPQVTVDGSQIEAVCPSRESYDCGIELEIEVPPGTRVNATNRGGQIRADGLDGALNLRTRSGQVRITDASGPISADTGNGGIRVDRSTSRQVTANARNGDIDLDLEDPQSVVATTLNGAVVIDLGTCRPYRLDVESPSHESVAVPSASETSGSTPTLTAKSKSGGVTIDCG